MAILTGLLLLGAGCATRDLNRVVLLDGRHVKKYSKAEAAQIPALAVQAAVANKWVFVATDVGFKLMYDLEIEPRVE